MENASKALIIAGAILLSILIIALGIYVFNMAKGATNTNSLTELEVSQFNQPFTDYRGRTIGSGVVSLLDKVITSAVEYKDSDERLPDIIYLDSRDKSPLEASAVAENDGTNLDEDRKLDDIIAAEGFEKGDYPTQWTIISNSENPKTDAMGTLRSKIAEKHYYQVGFHTNTTSGLIEEVIIAY